jgi:hypothetical protein
MASRLHVAVARGDGRILVTDSLTYCDASVTTHDVVVSGSFAGTPAFGLAYEHGVRALVAHAAGVGKDSAGISGLADADSRGIPAAAVETMSACIGDGTSVWREGVIAYANALARALGVTIGMPAATAARRLLDGPSGHAVPGIVNRTQRTALETPAGCAVLMMSTSFVTRANARDVICAGSHGGHVNTRPVLKTPPRAVIAFDGGMARAYSGIAGLSSLDAHDIAAAAVASASARIGDPESAWSTGTLSFVNRCARDRGLVAGMTVCAAAETLLSTWTVER